MHEPRTLRMHGVPCILRHFKLACMLVFLDRPEASQRLGNKVQPGTKCSREQSAAGNKVQSCIRLPTLHHQPFRRQQCNRAVTLHLTTSLFCRPAFVSVGATVLRSLVLDHVHCSSSPGDINLTVFTIAMPNRLAAVETLCSSWDGPLVAAFYSALEAEVENKDGESVEGRTQKGVKRGLRGSGEGVHLKRGAGGQEVEGCRVTVAFSARKIEAV
eukprot:364591-Chlamydomonas_euryale.AAC.9